MTVRNGSLRSNRSPLPRIQYLGNLKIFLILTFVASCALWPFLGLTVWHWVFFIILFLGLYYSYSRYAVPLTLYLTMMLLYWVVIPAFQNKIGVGYYTLRIDLPDFGVEALLFVVLHTLGIFLGFHVKRISLKRTAVHHYRFSVFGIILGLVLLVALVFLVGFEAIMLPRIEQWRTIEASSYLLFLENVVKLLPAFLMTYFVLESDKWLRRDVKILLFFVLAFFLLVISNPVNTGRFISLFGMLVIFLSYSIKSSRTRLLAWGLALIPFYAVFLLAITSMARSGFGHIDLAQIFASLRSLEFSSYSIFLDALHVDGFSQGNYLVSHLLIIIPSSWWSEKAGSIGMFVAENSGYVWSNVGLISFFNAFSDYGFFGLFLMSVLFGVVSKNFNPVVETPSFRNRRFMYGVVLTCLMPMVFRGDLSTAMIGFYSAIFAYESIRFLTRFTVCKRGV